MIEQLVELASANDPASGKRAVQERQQRKPDKNSPPRGTATSHQILAGRVTMA